MSATTPGMSAQANVIANAITMRTAFPPMVR